MQNRDQVLIALSKVYPEEYRKFLRECRVKYPITASRTNDPKRYQREWGYVRQKARALLKESHLEEYKSLMKSLRR